MVDVVDCHAQIITMGSLNEMKTAWRIAAGSGQMQSAFAIVKCCPGTMVYDYRLPCE